MKKNLLQQYFPMIRTREEILKEIKEDEHLNSIFNQWSEEQQEEFLNFTTGIRGVKILYDCFYKEVMNPDTVPERMNDFLSLLLKRDVRIIEVLPNDNSRIADDTIVLYEKSNTEFRKYPNDYVHNFQQCSDTGLQINLLQKYIFVPLDIFKKSLHNNGIETKLDAWLAFFSSDDPDTIISIIDHYPEFKAMVSG